MGIRGADERERLYMIYQVLGSPQKRKIIEVLGTKGPLPFSDLKKSLSMSVGALYYNLDQLRPFVAQEADRRYSLTSEGREVFKIMNSELDLMEPARASSRAPSWMLELFDVIRQIFLPREFLSTLFSRGEIRFIALGILALGILACSLTGTDVFLTYVRPGFKGSFTIPELSLYVKTDPRPLSATSFIATWLIFSLVPYSIASLIKWEWGWRKLYNFLQGSAVGMLPIVAYVVVYDAVLKLGFLGYATFLLLGAFFAAMWAITIGIVASTLNIVKRISTSKSVVLMVLVTYLCLATHQAILVKWFVTP